jgi:hypothetical protein
MRWQFYAAVAGAVICFARALWLAVRISEDRAIERRITSFVRDRHTIRQVAPSFRIPPTHQRLGRLKPWL